MELEELMYKKLLNYTIAGILFTSIFGTLSHFIYEWSGFHWLAGLFTPVNESTWEHMKLLFFPMLFYGIFMWFSLRKDYPCIAFSYPLGILAGTFAIPILFYTYSGILGKNYTAADILIFYISVVLAFASTYSLCRCKKEKYSLIPALLVLALAICFLCFTISPPEFGIFSPPAYNK